MRQMNNINLKFFKLPFQTQQMLNYLRNKSMEMAMVTVDTVDIHLQLQVPVLQLWPSDVS